MHGKWNSNPPTLELPSPSSPFYDNQSWNWAQVGRFHHPQQECDKSRPKVKELKRDQSESLLRTCDTPRKSTSKDRPSKSCFGKAYSFQLIMGIFNVQVSLWKWTVLSIPRLSYKTRLSTSSRTCGGLRVLEFVVEDTTNAVLAAFSPRTQTSKSSDEDFRSSGLLGDVKRQAIRPRPRSLHIEAGK